MNFSWAMDLDPKGANSQIKDALDRSMNKAAQENIDIGTSHLDDHVADHGHLHEDEDAKYATKIFMFVIENMPQAFSIL